MPWQHQQQLHMLPLQQQGMPCQQHRHTLYEDAGLQTFESQSCRGIAGPMRVFSVSAKQNDMAQRGQLNLPGLKRFGLMTSIDSEFLGACIDLPIWRHGLWLAGST